MESPTASTVSTQHKETVFQTIPFKSIGFCIFLILLGVGCVKVLFSMNITVSNEGFYLTTAPLHAGDYLSVAGISPVQETETESKKAFVEELSKSLIQETPAQPTEPFVTTEIIRLDEEESQTQSDNTPAQEQAATEEPLDLESITETLIAPTSN